MEPKEMKKFQVIGACAQTPTISWEEESRLLDGVPYLIDFFQNFSTWSIDGHIITDIPVSALLDAIVVSPHENTTYTTHNLPPERNSSFNWDYVDKQLEKKRKWETKHTSVSPKKAYKKWKKAIKRLEER